MSSLSPCLGDIFSCLLHTGLAAPAAAVNVRRGRGSSSLSALVLADPAMLELSQQGRFPRKPLAEQELPGLPAAASLRLRRDGKGRAPSPFQARVVCSDSPKAAHGPGCSLPELLGSAAGRALWHQAASERWPLRWAGTDHPEGAPGPSRAAVLPPGTGREEPLVARGWQELEQTLLSPDKREAAAPALAGLLLCPSIRGCSQAAELPRRAQPLILCMENFLPALLSPLPLPPCSFVPNCSYFSLLTSGVLYSA